MSDHAIFTIPDGDGRESVFIEFDGARMRVPAGITVAAALLSAGVRQFRSSTVKGAPRAPYCMMGNCFECLVEIDGVPALQSCLIKVEEGMRIRHQQGAVRLQIGTEEDA